MKKIFLFFQLLFSLSIYGQRDKQEVPSNTNGVPLPTHSFVNDFTGTMLDSTHRLMLEKKLKDYQDSTSTQIVIVCLPKLPKNKNGTTWVLEDLSLQIGRIWGIGQQGKNNGILIVVALDDHKIRIETGYGAEGAVPDITCKRIIDRDISPNFKDKHYYEGLDNATTNIIHALAGEYDAIARKEDLEEKNQWAILIGIGICAIIGLFFIWIATALGGVYIGIFWSVVYSVTLWHALLAALIGAGITLIVSFLARLFLSGSPDGFSPDGDISGGDSGGEGLFSGAGGDFGGGGASGSW